MLYWSCLINYLITFFFFQQKFSLLMALTHLIEASSNIKNEFIKENGITTIVVATINTEKNSRINNAANMIIKLCADTFLQQNDQKQNVDNLDIDNPNVINEYDHNSDNLHTSKVSNEQTNIDDITSFVQSFQTRNYIKTYRNYDMKQNFSKITPVNKDPILLYTPLQHITHTKKNPKLQEDILKENHISNTTTDLKANNTFYEELDDIHDILHQETCESLEQTNDNKLLRETLSKITNDRTETDILPDSNEIIYQLKKPQDCNPRELSKIISQDNYSVSHNTENKSEMLLLHENNIQCNDEPDECINVTHSIHNCSKNFQNNKDVQINVLQTEFPARIKESRINREITNFHNMIHREHHSIPKLYGNPNIQTNATLHTNAQKFLSEPKDCYSNQQSRTETMNHTNLFPEKNIYSGVSTQHILNTEKINSNKYRNQNQSIQSSSGQHYSKEPLDRPQNSAIKTKKIFSDQNIYSKTSQLPISKHLHVGNQPISKQNDISFTNKITYNEIMNRNAIQRLLESPQSKHIQGINTKTNRQNNASRASENYNQNHPKTSHFPKLERKTDLEKHRSSSTKKECHDINANKNIHASTSQCGDPKLPKITHSEITLPQNDLSMREIPHNKCNNPATQQLPQFKMHRSSESQINQDNNSINDISARCSMSSSFISLCNSNTISNSTNNRIKVYSDSKSKHHDLCKKGNNAKKCNRPTRFRRYRNIKTGNHISCNKNETEVLSKITSHFINSSNKCGETPDIDRDQHITYLNETDTFCENSKKSCTQNYSHREKNFQMSENEMKKSDSWSKSNQNEMDNMKDLEHSKLSNSSPDLTYTHIVNKGNIRERELQSNQNQFHKSNLIPALEEKQMYKTSSYKKLRTEKQEDEVLANEIENTYNKTHRNLEDTSTSSCNSSEEKISGKKENKRQCSIRRPMLRYSRIELDNLVAGVAKYGLDFKVML